MTPEQCDRLVAEKVMGWQERPCDDRQLIEYDGGWECSVCGHSGGWIDFDQSWPDHVALPPRYSQDIAAAWKIVEMMVAKMGYDNLGFAWRGPNCKAPQQYLDPPSRFDCYVLKEGTYRLGGRCWYVAVEDDGLHRVFAADMACEAICIAGLAASGVEVRP